MKQNDDILVMGDVHYDFASLNSFVNIKKPKMILQVGDFGYWPRFTPPPRNRNYPKKPLVPKAGDTKIYFCEGNHDDIEELWKLENNEVYPNVFYMKRGSIMTLDDGRNVLFMGGGLSIDRESRILGGGDNGWFHEEILTQQDVMSIPLDTKIDIVISHTCPEEFEMPYVVHQSGKYKDFSRTALSYVLETFRPSLWHFGHWHVMLTGYDHGCRWYCMNRENNGAGWWLPLRK